jgi:tetratricopeptide (TPR) repeat protein
MQPHAEDASGPGVTAPSTLPRRPFRLDHRWLVLVPALLVFLIYLPALHYQFVWDDTIFLRDLPAYRDPSLWLPALFRPFLLSPNYIRPLALLTFVGEAQLAGLDPTVFHLTNLLLHALNTALVALLALRLLGRRAPTPDSQSPIPNRQFPIVALPALAVGLLYGLHPALIEGVAFISSRFDLLMTAFLLLALLADVAVRRLWLRALLVGLAFFGAALSKEMAVAFVLALPFWHLALAAVRPADPVVERRRPWYDYLGVYGAVLVAGLLYLAMRLLVLGQLLVSNPERIPPVGWWLQHLLLVGKSLAEYVLVIVWPFTTLAPIHYSSRPLPLGDAASWFALVPGWLLVAGWVTGLVFLVRRKPQAGWLAVAGTLAVLPVTNILPLELGGGAFVAERYLLFPVTLLALAVGVLLRPLLAGEVVWPQVRAGRVLRTAATALLPLWLVASLATVQLTLPHWSSDLTLWNWGAARAPQSATPPTNMSLQYTNLGLPKQGLQLAQQAIQLDPRNADAWDNAGLALFVMAAYTDSQSAFEQAVALQPENALFWNNLAGALREQGKLADAEEILLDRVLQLDPNLPVAHLNLGIVYLRADRPDLAAQHLQVAIRLLPLDQVPDAQAFLDQAQEPDRWLRLGDLLLTNDQPEQALQAYSHAEQLGARPADVAAGASSALIALKEWDSASQVLQRGLAAAPDDPRLYYNAGIVERERGNIDLARQLFAKAAELAPQWELPKQALEALPGQ